MRVSPHPQPQPQSAADVPLSVSSLLHLVRDAEHLTLRYGSTSAGCARLEELEHAHVEMQAQIAALQQKLSMAMAAAAAAQADHQAATTASAATLSSTSIGGGRSHADNRMVDIDSLLSFLQRHCACRGNLSLLHLVLQDYQRALVMAPDVRFPPRDVLLSISEILPMGTTDQHHHPHHQLQQQQPQPRPHQQHPHQPQQQQPHSTEAVGGHPPVPYDTAWKNKIAEYATRNPSKQHVPAAGPAAGSGPGAGPGPGSAGSSPARATGNGAIHAQQQQPQQHQPVSHPRAIAPTGRVALPPATQRSARPVYIHQEHKQAASAAITLSSLSRPSSSSESGSPATSAAAHQPPPAPQRQAPAAPPPQAPAPSAKPRGSATAAPAAKRPHVEAPAPPPAAVTHPRKRSSQRYHDEAEQVATTTTTIHDHRHAQAQAAAAAAVIVFDGPTAAEEDASGSGSGKRKRGSAVSAAAASAAALEVEKKKKTNASPPEVVVKQNLSLPHDRRNVVELKHSSQLLTVEALDALTKRAPWDEFYKLRATYSHILDYQALPEPARKWFLGTLRVQFVWRREFWERLHWLPMSETVCFGPEWDKVRQTRKRRANRAIAAWRKVYSDSLELMRQRLLPEDVWCDVALWYMPSTPLYWLPNSGNLELELDAVDSKHPVRCYHLRDLSKHPFYRDDETQRKYPHKHELPSPKLLTMQNEDKESRVNFTPE